MLRFVKKFLRSERGSALPLIGLGIFVLLGATGSAIDLGRLQVVQSRLQQAVDAAGLAAGAQPSGTTLLPIVSKYFYANFPTGFMGTNITTLTVTPNSDNTIITILASGTMSTTFMKVFNTSTLNISATTQITRANSGLELVLVLDNTGSMANPVNPSNSNTPKITAMQQAAGTLLTTLYGTNNTVNNLWVGVVPFSQAVNIGTSYPSWVSGASADFGPTITGSNCPSYSGTSGTYSSGPKCAYKLNGTAQPTFGGANWEGCVMARTAPYDQTDDTPSTAIFPVYNYPATADGSYNYNPWRTPVSTTKNGTTTTTTTYSYANSSNLGVAQSPNALCPHVLQPMVAEKATIQTTINALTAAGSTVIPAGMSWGYRMLSPKWAGLWGGEMNSTGNTNFPVLPLAYHTALMNKALILMTDGMNSLTPGNYTAYQYLDSDTLGSTNETTAESNLDTRTLAICTALKNNGVIIYTIGFGTNGNNNPSDATSVNGPMLQSCATDANHYFLAPTNAQLQSVFQQIANQLANLRVSH